MSEGIRNTKCVCGHNRDMHACTFSSVRCICGCNEFRYPPASVPAPHAEAEAEAAWQEWYHEGIDRAMFDRSAFIAGYLRGRGDR